MESRYGVDKIRQIWNVRIVRVWYLDHATEIGPPLQIIVLNNNLPEDPQPDDCAFAINTVVRFDISVCKCVIPNLLALDKILTMSRLDIVNWEMEYDMRKFKSVEIVWKRILKYSARGFKLCRLQFGDQRVIHLVDGNIRIFAGGNQILSNETSSCISMERTETVSNISLPSSDENNDVDTAF
jgi:hypothetical protein